MSHFRAISPSHGAAATVALTLLLASCSDLALPPSEVYGISDLIVLPQKTDAPDPAAQSFWVSNSRATTIRINHPDNYNTLYLEFSFPPNSLASLLGAPLSAEDSVRLTAAPRPGAYGFTLSPSELEFSSGSSPTALFSFSVYGSATSSDISTSYSSSSAYVAALSIWRETGVDEWQIAPGSGSAAVDEVSARIEAAGRFVLAAPR